MKNLEQLLDRICVTVDNEEYNADFIRRAVTLSGSLTDDFANQAKYVAIIGFAYEHSIRAVAKLKVQKDRMYALVDARTRNNDILGNNGKKGLTEKQIESVVITSEEYQLIQNELIEAEFQAGLLRAARDALNHKKDALVGTGATYRSELAAERTLLRGQ